MRARSISTRVGDGGTTRLYAGEVVSKCDPRVEALGEVDELVSALGLARAAGLGAACSEQVLALQRTLFRVGAELAMPPGGASAGIEPADVEALDALGRSLEEGGTMPADFVVPGARLPGAALDLARAIARRCERRVAACAAAGQTVSPHLRAWMNRLSDVLWLLARVEEGTSTPLRERR